VLKKHALQSKALLEFSLPSYARNTFIFQLRFAQFRLVLTVQHLLGQDAQ